MRPATRPLAWIGILVLLVQLWVPSVHATAYAQRHGNALAYAICGSGSPALQALLLARLPDEVKRALDDRTTATPLADCALCAAVHGSPAAGVPAVPAIVPRPAAPAAVIPAISANLGASPVLTPPARGPPTPG
ncbi:Protein of unknown function [Fontimonas thermophila]|uniref:DUF2946 domain-containing protein n=1 Tax=Fontimonas thermophila TaxID=1076937 RepID=A0A1I2JZZ5_9GAMM|nr:DUF2946 family protein [Fontimonas thermophila]SFF59729.1 Protein of unknown function [Fontimonas thermophila]